MPRLIVRADDRVVKECPLGPIVTIGRLPDNTIVIENPAVSGHHACVVADGSRFVVEDLESTNGTFLAGRRITRHRLRKGDVVQIADHTLTFDPAGKSGSVEASAAERLVSNPGETVFLDADKHQALLAMLKETEASAESADFGMPQSLGVLRVLSGRTDQPVYQLQAYTSFIGKADSSLIRLKGWFKPSVAVVITRSAEGYTATRMRSGTKINGQPLTDRRDLKEGDVLDVGGLTLEFGFNR